MGIDSLIKSYKKAKEESDKDGVMDEIIGLLKEEDNFKKLYSNPFLGKSFRNNRCKNINCDEESKKESITEIVNILILSDKSEDQKPFKKFHSLTVRLEAALILFTKQVVGGGQAT